MNNTEGSNTMSNELNNNNNNKTEGSNTMSNELNNNNNTEVNNTMSNELNEGRDWGTYQSNEEKVSEDDGYRYTENKNGSINVKMRELHRWLDTQPIEVMGEYIDDDGCKTPIYGMLDTLLENSMFGKVDMFGKEHRTPLTEVIDVITKVYNKNDWEVK